MMHVLYEIHEFEVVSEDDSWMSERQWNKKISLIAASENLLPLESIKNDKETYQHRVQNARSEYYSDERLKMGFSFVTAGSALDWLNQREKTLGAFEKASNEKLRELVGKTGLPAGDIVSVSRKNYFIDLVEVL